MNRASVGAVLAVAAGLSAGVYGQTTCGRPVGPDLIISDIAGSTSYPGSGGRSAFSVGARQTDTGNALIGYFQATPQHPVTGQALFRLTNDGPSTRFEQIGQSWLFHGFLPLNMPGPCATCQGGDSTHLGIGCSTSDTASITGQQSALGPTWQVNPTTGQFPFPPANPSFSGSMARRLQAANTDLLPGPNYSYFVEVHAIDPDDAAAGNGANNASFRPCNITVVSTPYALILTGTTVPELPAISAWRAADPLVTQTQASAPGGGGVFVVSSRATDLGTGVWRYEFAVYNLNCDAAAGSFSVPVPADAVVSNIGFHDVDYTDGDGVNNVSHDGTDWSATRSGSALTWATAPYSTSPNGNALRWGTLYNFRFDCSAAPDSAGAATVGLWKTPDAAITVAAQVPAAACYANCDASTTPPILNVGDFICFLAEFAGGDSRANCDNSTTPPVLNVGDFICFQARFVVGCG